jgi:hypothetical protein
MVEDDRYCIDIVTQLSAVRAALRRAEEEILTDHVAHCVEQAISSGNKTQQRAAGKAKTPYWPGPSSFERVSEDVLHNPVHRWIGGNMADATSPNDPVFFLHHTFLDKLGRNGNRSIGRYLPIARPRVLQAMT